MNPLFVQLRIFVAKDLMFALSGARLFRGALNVSGSACTRLTLQMTSRRLREKLTKQNIKGASLSATFVDKTYK